jgi:hypothetical protein
MPKFRERLRLDKLSSAASTAIDVVVDGDSNERLHIEAGGKFVWGGGSAPGDVNLYRDSSGVLRTDGTLKSSVLFVDGIEVDTTGATGDQVLKFNGTKFIPGTASTVASLDDLTDVTIVSVATNQVLQWNGTAWVNSNAAGGATISDNAPSSPSAGQIWFESDTGKTFIYYDSQWVEVGTQPLGPSGPTGPVGPTGPTGATGIGATGATGPNGPLDILTDVVITSPLQFQGLMYDGTNWVNSNIPDVYLVRNNTGSTIPKGTLVGAVGAEPSGRIDVAPFQVTGTENSELRAMGIATSNISSGVNGEVMSFGTLTGLDTRGSTASALAVGDETWAAGDILFAHPTVDGKLTNVRPQHDLAVAFITVRHASSGQIAIRIIPGNNHLEWMHDVVLTSPTDGQVLQWNGSSWINATVSSDVMTDTRNAALILMDIGA